MLVVLKVTAERRLTADVRWSQSSHQKLLPPNHLDAKRIETARIGTMPDTYAMTLTPVVYESCGLLQMVACMRSISARM